ncbi:MAG: tetratricopeptide repeat protein, partial [Muribaculaceae bacterium]|nr:tetratricopeptide repeat protein [Muribaculaceae bacterium]
MELKKVLLIACVLAAPGLAMAQPLVMNTNGEGYNLRGLLMHDRRNYVGSIHQLSHFNTYLGPLWDEDIEAEYILALNNFELGKPVSLTMLEEFIENHPYEPLAVAARAKVGDYYFYHGEFAQALTSYEQVREKALDDDTDEDVLYRRAYSNLMLGNYNEAHDLFDRLSKTKQYSSAATFFNAYIEYANERYDNAMELFQSVDRVGELGYQSQYYMCQIMYKQGDYSNAITLGESLIEDQANDYFTAEMNRIVGESYYRMGNNAKAKPFLEKFVALVDSDSPSRRTATYMLGVVDFNNRDYKESIEHMLDVTQVDDAMTQSAYLYVGQSRLKSG